MRDKREKKRRRVNPTHRWTDTQTKILLAAILDEVQNNGVEMFEKPTAMRFYDKVTKNVNEINGIANWTVCKSKMRHLKQTYMQALAWHKQIGDGLLAEGNTRAVADYMKKYCPFWDLLHSIFGETLKDMKDEQLYGADIKDGDPLLVVLREEQHDGVDHYEDEEEEGDGDEIENSETDQSFSENDFNTFKNQFKQKPATPPTASIAKKTTNKSTSSTTTFSANSGSIAVLVSMQEKKLQFEEIKWKQQQENEMQRLELEREKCKLMKLELKQRQELKQLEIERDERLAMAKMKLETDSEERIKKFELELKIKSNLF